MVEIDGPLCYRVRRKGLVRCPATSKLHFAGADFQHLGSNFRGFPSESDR